MTASDRGVAAFRARLRTDIRALEDSREPFQPAALADPPIPTYCGDTVLRVPRLDGDDEALILAHSRKVMEIVRGADGVKGEARDDAVIRRLKELEASLA